MKKYLQQLYEGIFTNNPVLVQLIGMCPFTGISVGADSGSPVDWKLFKRHRSFAFTNHDLEVRYVPGELAPYNRETIVQIEQAAGLIYD